jgi:PAS domain S-box-containing protein
MALEETHDALFESVFDAAPVGIALLSPLGRFMRSNAALQAMLGYDDATLQAHRFADLTHPDDIDAHATALNELLAGTRTSYELSTRCVRRSGAVVHAQVTVSVVRPGVLLAIVKDVTTEWEARDQLRRSREQLGIALSSVDMGFFEWDIVTDRMMWSEEMSRLAGLRPEPLVHPFGSRFYLIHPDDIEMVKAAIHETLADRSRCVFEREFRLVRPDAEERWVFAKAHVFRNRTGEPVRALGALFDITERRRLQEQFFHAQKMEAIGRFASSVAHDFNNVLAVIVGQIDVMLMTHALPSLTRQGLTDISEAAERAAHLIQQLLTFSRKGDAAPRVLDPNETLARLEALLRTLAGGNQLNVSLTPDVGHIRIDERQLEQALINLVINARDAMPVAGPVTISTGRTSDGRVSIAVRDTGIGIDEDAMPRLFEPFFTTKPPGQGTGLGLAVVLAIVEQANGEVRVDSVPGRGTTFDLRFEAA